MIRHIKYYFDQRELLRLFIVNDLKSRYTGSVSGIYWSIINPLLMILIYTFVFSSVLKIEFHKGSGTLNFAFYLICGMLPWISIQDSVLRSITSIVDNSELVKRAKFPASILPIHIVLSNHLTMLIGLTILIVILIVVENHITIAVLQIFILIVPQLMFTLGLSWVFSSIYVFVRDIQPFVQNFVLLWMFLTPVFYPSTIFPQKYEIFLIINPAAHVVNLYREVIMKGNIIPYLSYITFSIQSLITFVAGYFIYIRLQPKFTDRL
ncbi:MAG: ABC transporter permease [Deltaproteobacteria bacterium]|nr:ABC transporter permease [Deltaproteobacteria bacterium]